MEARTTSTQKGFSPFMQLFDIFKELLDLLSSLQIWGYIPGQNKKP